jgi:hypothetical protein
MFATNVAGTSNHGRARLNQMLESGNRKDDGGLFRALRSGMAPGSGLDDLNRTTLPRVSAAIDLLRPNDQIYTEVNLWRWLRDNISMAIMDSYYGPRNPFIDPKVKEAFWYALLDLSHDTPITLSTGASRTMFQVTCFCLAS